MARTIKFSRFSFLFCHAALYNITYLVVPNNKINTSLFSLSLSQRALMDEDDFVEKSRNTIGSKASKRLI
jgi:hypothetical protein